MLDRVVRWAVRCVSDGDRRDELLAVTGEAVRNGTRRDAVAEVAGLVGLNLRLRNRRATGDDPVTIWRQGLWIGGLLLALLALVELGVRALADPAPHVVVAFLLASCAFIGVAAWLPMMLAVTGPVAVVLTVLVTVEQPGAGSDLVRLGVLGVAWLLGTPPRPARRRFTALAWCAPVVVGVASSAVVAESAVLDASTVAVVGVVGAVCLVAGWFDPRLAVAATVVWVWRFLAVDPPRIGDAVVALAGDLDLEALLVRWIAMAAGVVVGLAVSRLSVRRAAAL